MTGPNIKELRDKCDQYRAQSARCYVDASAETNAARKEELLEAAEKFRALAEETEGLIQELRSHPS
jgi:hypothetical protein